MLRNLAPSFALAASASLVSVFVACGGTAGALLPDGDGGAATTPGSDAAVGVDADAIDGAAPIDGSTKNDAIADAASAKDERLDPIEVGRAWTYNVQVLGFYPSCENGLGVATTLSKTTKKGKTAFQVQSLCKDAGTFEYAVEKDRVYYWLDNEWHLATDEPVQAGHEWTDGYYDYVWEDEGTVTVAAGTFDHCFTARRKVDYDSFTTFCRGVGPVHWHFEDGFGNGYDAVLASKSF